MVGLLSTLMVISVAACGKKNDNLAAFDKNTVYREVEIPVSFPDNFSAYNFRVAGNKIFFTANSFDDKSWQSKNYWAFMNIDGTDLKLNELADNSYIDYVLASESGEIVLCYTKYETSGEPEVNYDDEVAPLEGEPNEPAVLDDGEILKDDDAVTDEDVIEIDSDFGVNDGMVYPDSYGVNKLYFEAIDETGKTKKTYCLTDDLGLEYLYRCISLDDKFIVTGSDNTVYQFNYNLELLGKKSVNEGTYYDYSDIFKLKDGTYVTRVWGDTGLELKKFDIDKIEATSKIELPFEASIYGIEAGRRSGYDLLLSSGNQYYGFNIGDAAPTPLINFVNSDLATSYFDVFVPVDEKTFFGTYSDWTNDNRETKFCRYEKVNPEDVKDKEILTLGCMYIDSGVRTEVVKYNKSHDDIRIVVKDYSEYNTEEDYMAGYKQFNSDIASGKGPDIVVTEFDNHSDAYAKKGLYLDLNTMLEKDEELSKEDFSANILEALSLDGKLFFISPSYYIRTIVGKKSLIGDRKSWTLDEMIQFEKTLPEGSSLFEINTRESILSEIISMNYKYFIDDKNGKCNFNNEEFIKALEYSKTLPEGNDEYYNSLYGEDYYMDYESKWRENKIALLNLYMSSISDLNYSLHGRIGEPVSFVGYPSVDGNGSGIVFNSVYAISAKTKNKEAAWEFIRVNLTEEAQDSVYNLPLRKSSLEKMAEQATKKKTYLDENGKEVEYDDYYYMNGVEILLEPFTREEVNEILEFIGSANKRSSYMSEDISNIITEEAAPFYNNQKSAADVANIIQSRISIMMAEKQ